MMPDVYEIYDFEYNPNSEVVYVEAEVEDAVQSYPATRYEPEQWTHGRCSTSFMWNIDEDGPVNKKNIAKYLETYEPDWILVPFDNSEDAIDSFDSVNTYRTVFSYWN